MKEVAVKEVEEKNSLRCQKHLQSKARQYTPYWLLIHEGSKYPPHRPERVKSVLTEIIFWQVVREGPV